MKTAEALLSELIEHARPPKGCTIKLIECLDNTFLNWIVIRGDMTGTGRERFDKKVLYLCQTDPRVDWSAVKESEDSRRVLVYLEKANGPRLGNLTNDKKATTINVGFNLKRSRD